MTARFGVKHHDDGAIVRAVEGRRKLGELYLEFLDPEGLWQTQQEILYDGDALHSSGDVEGGRIYLREAEKLGRCLMALEALQSRLGRRIEWLMVPMETDTGRLTLAQLAYLYRVATVAAGRRQAALIVPACFEFIYGLEGDRRLGRAWKSPAFRAGLQVSGPVAYAQPALAAARAGNQRPARHLKARLLRTG